MANLLSYDASQLLAFILVLVRVSGIIATAPVFGSSNIPPQIKVVLSLMLALILYPFIPLITVYPDRPDHYIMLIASEQSLDFRWDWVWPWSSTRSHRNKYL
jgi:flagellar biosynthetic protein FliR